MRGWRLEKRKLIFDHPSMPVFWKVPADFRMPSDSTLSLARSVLMAPFGENVDVVPGKRRRTGRIGLAFSGGVDSAAALRLLPNVVPMYTRVANPQRRHVLDNAMLAVDEVGGIAVRSNYDELALLYGRKQGFYGHAGFTTTAILYSEYYGLDTVADGNIMDRIYLLSEHGAGTRYNPDNFDRVNAAFRTAGMEYCIPCAGLTEVSTSRIAAGFRYAMGCVRGSAGEPCRNCMKCYRKLALAGSPIPSCAESESIIAKEEIKMLPTLLWAVRHRGLRHPVLESFDKDISWVDRWYPDSIRFVPEQYRSFFLARLKDYAIPPVTDSAPVMNWSSART